jgi:hypothetical protein
VGSNQFLSKMIGSHTWSNLHPAVEKFSEGCLFQAVGGHKTLTLQNLREQLEFGTCATARERAKNMVWSGLVKF